MPVSTRYRDASFTARRRGGILVGQTFSSSANFMVAANDVRLWHLADTQVRLSNVRYCG
jgi:hypothetical protein